MVKKKCIVRVFGGLGNQLFCYAAARRFSCVNNLQLKIDAVTGFLWDHQYNRSYQLDKFNIKTEIATPIESFNYFGGRIARSVARFGSKHLPQKHYLYLTERDSTGFCPELIRDNYSHHVYMDGYWHSDKYFKDIENIIRDDLKIIMPMKKSTINESANIKQAKTPVCIGIRLFQEAKDSTTHKKLDVEYYAKAVNYLLSKVSNPHFFIFCNDIDWVRDNFALSHPMTFIEPKIQNERAYEDIWLMSQCYHFIIPNSTYHWWGAWLSEYTNKIVVAPKNGFHNRDIIPDNWLTI